MQYAQCLPFRSPNYFTLAYGLGRSNNILHTKKIHLRIHSTEENRRVNSKRNIGDGKGKNIVILELFVSFGIKK